MEAGEERSVVQRLREKGLIPIKIGSGAAAARGEVDHPPGPREA